MQNLPEKSEKAMVYQLENGDEMRLTIATVKKFLVQGRSEFVTDSEVLYFMHECKARRLNPFLRQCWLIKYSQNDNAQIIESIHHKRAKARTAPDCKGWKKGLILQDKQGNLKKSKGIILDGETLIGAYFEATPEGWNVPYELEINLNGYIKKKRDGSTTQFWQKDNQPTQLMKVVESQGLSALWGGAIGDTYIPEEMPEPIDFALGQNGSYEQGPDPEEVLKAELKDPMINKFVDSFLTEAYPNKNSAWILAEAAKDPGPFKSSFEAWKAREMAKAEKSEKPESEQPKKAKAKSKKKAKPIEELPPSIEDNPGGNGEGASMGEAEKTPSGGGDVARDENIQTLMQFKTTNFKEFAELTGGRKVTAASDEQIAEWAGMVASIPF